MSERGVDYGGVSRTEQHHKDACDINNVIRKYNKTGLIKQRLSQGVYGDFTSVIDYQTAVNRVNDANNDFMALPSRIRSRFKNDPGLLVDFISDENNRDEAIALGIIENPVTNEVEKVSNRPVDVNKTAPPMQDPAGGGV